MSRIPFKSIGRPLPLQILRPLAAGVAPDRGQFLAQSSSGFAVLQSGSVPNTIPLGPADRDEEAGTSNSAAKMITWTTFVSGYPSSTSANDSFADTDMGVVAWGKDEGTPGKLSNLSGNNRSMLGIVYGLDYENDRTPIIWTGPVAHSVAKGVHMANAKAFAWLDVHDAAASTAIAERAIPSETFHGVVTAVQFTGAAIAADNTDYITVTIAKRSASDSYAAATTIATYDSRAANQGTVSALTPASFALSGTAANLNLLETDVITITTVKGGAGKVISGAFRVIGKVQ